MTRLLGWLLALLRLTLKLRQNGNVSMYAVAQGGSCATCVAPPRSTLGECEYALSALSVHWGVQVRRVWWRRCSSPLCWPRPTLLPPAWVWRALRRVCVWRWMRTRCTGECVQACGVVVVCEIVC